MTELFSMLSFGFRFFFFPPGVSAGKESAVMWGTWVQSLGWEDPLERECLLIPVFWPGKFHGMYSPWGCKEMDMTEQLSLSYFYFSKSANSFPFASQLQ